MIKPIPSSGSLVLPALLCCLPMVGLAIAPAAVPAGPLRELSVSPTQVVTGRITDDKGEGLPGVTVLVKGTTNGTSTGADGSFSLDVPDNAILVISSVGYVSQEIAVAGRTTIDVRLVTDNQQLSDVVVVGYLTQNRQDVTGAVSTVSATDVRRAPVATVAEAIQGRVAGVQVTNSGAPGQAPNIVIRGLGTIASGSSPLYVIDGLWVQGTSGQRDFNPADVESVQILKDAASLAPYGASGANGVVVITTRKGKNGPPQVTFSANGGVQNLVKRLDLTGATEWAAITNQAYDNTGQARLPFAANTALAPDTDWQNEFFKQGSIQDYNLGFSGGGPNSNFLVSGGYFKQDGTVQGPDFERYSFRVNTGFNRGRLRVGQNALLTRANQTRVNGLPFIDVLRMLPVNSVYDATNPGGFGIGNDNAITFGTNPIALQSLFNDTGTSNRLQGNVYGEVSIFDFLRYRLNLATEYHGFRDQEKRQYGFWRRNDPNGDISSFAENQGNEVFGMVENTLTFDKSFGQNNLTAVAGYSQQRFEQEFTRGVNFGYGTGPNYYWALDAGTLRPQAIGSSYVWAKRSFFGQLTYDYDQRYLFTAAYRRDGSSRFDPEKYGNFGAASVGWRISKEKFFEGITLLSDLKLRASFGQLGNDVLGGAYGGSYRFQGTINTNANYVLGGQIQNGAIQTNYSSPDIRWESRRTTNVGLDAGFLENRLTLSADYYMSQTFDLLIAPDLPIFFGNAGPNPFRNLGKLENKGFEFQLGYAENRTKFRYGASVNLTTLSNKVLDLGRTGGTEVGAANFFNGGPGAITRTEVGEEVGSFYLYQFDGIYQTGDDDIPTGLQAGDVRYKDISGPENKPDGIITEADRSHVGRVFPKIQYGANLNLGYGAFDLTAFFQGVQGNDVFNISKFWLDRTDDNGNHRAGYSPWSATNPSTDTPRALKSGGNGGIAPGNNDRFETTRWLESGSYLRLKNVQLGFTLPKSLLDRAKYVQSLRIYATGQNVFTVTDYTGYDPETVGSGTLGRGIDEGSYPNLRSFTLGIQAGF